MLNKPLWRIMLGILGLAFALQRGAMVVLLLESAAPFTLWFGFVLQAVAAVWLWVALNWIDRAIVPGLWLLGGSFVAGAVLSAFIASAMPPLLAIMQIAAAALGTPFLTYVTRRALQDDDRTGAS